MAERLTAKDVLSATEVAELLRIPKSTVYDLARRGKIPSAKVGKRVRFVRQQIEAMLISDDRVR